MLETLLIIVLIPAAVYVVLIILGLILGAGAVAGESTKNYLTDIVEGFKALKPKDKVLIVFVYVLVVIVSAWYANG